MGKATGQQTGWDKEVRNEFLLFVSAVPSNYCPHHEPTMTALKKEGQKTGQENEHRSEKTPLIGEGDGHTHDTPTPRGNGLHAF